MRLVEAGEKTAADATRRFGVHMPVCRTNA
jgi:hypothetical protein